MQYQVHKEPIPLEDLELIDLAESDGKKGSFKNKVLRHPSTGKFNYWLYLNVKGNNYCY